MEHTSANNSQLTREAAAATTTTHEPLCCESGSPKHLGQLGQAAVTIITSSLQLMLALIQLGLHLSLFTVSLASRAIPLLTPGHACPVPDKQHSSHPTATPLPRMATPTTLQEHHSPTPQALSLPPSPLPSR